MHLTHPVPETAEERCLRALEVRFRNELLSEAERCELRDRILKLQSVSFSMDLTEEDVERVQWVGKLIDLMPISDRGFGTLPCDDPETRITQQL